MNLGELRQAVRDQVDQDETDLPNTRLDGYIREGYERIIQMEDRWPFFEQTWTQAILAQQETFTLPVTAAVITAIRSEHERFYLIDHRDGEDFFNFDPSPGRTCYWSRVGNTAFLWPPTDTGITLVLRGFRLPTDWIAGGAGSEVDADERLHWPIVNYALSRVYIQQEDEVLSAQYLNDFREGAALAHEAVMRPWMNESLVLGGGRLRRRLYPPVYPHAFLDV